MLGDVVVVVAAVVTLETQYLSRALLLYLRLGRCRCESVSLRQQMIDLRQATVRKIALKLERKRVKEKWQDGESEGVKLASGSESDLLLLLLLLSING